MDVLTTISTGYRHSPVATPLQASKSQAGLALPGPSPSQILSLVSCCLLRFL